MSGHYREGGLSSGVAFKWGSSAHAQCMCMHGMKLTQEGIL